MRDEATRWFSEAEWDLETARILHERRRYNAAVFYAYPAGTPHEAYDKETSFAALKAAEEIIKFARRNL